MTDFRYRTLIALSLSELPAVESTCGIDWARVLQSLATPNDHEDEGKRWRMLGMLDELLPSGRCYTVAQVGCTVDTEAFAEDLDWFAALRAEAETLGLEITADEHGDALWVIAPVVECVQVGERYIMSA